RCSKQPGEENDRSSTGSSSSKPTNNKSISSANHISSSTSSASPKNHDKSAKDKSQTSGQNSVPSPFNHLSKLDGLVSPFESYRKKEGKAEAGHEPSPFLPVSSAASVTNPLFTL